MAATAREALLASLEAGKIREFNGWRQAFPHAAINLSETNFKDADLRGANLAGADLRWANLEGADLREATLAGANLKEANTRGAKLTGVSYAYATMSRAQLDSIEEQNRTTVYLID
jgi:uncharacterized protein YjbI with pentapeptide repeats